MTVVSINNVPNLQEGVTPDPSVTALIDKYDLRHIAKQHAAGESVLGDVIADAQLEATAPAGLGEAVVGFMNPGSIRNDLFFAASVPSAKDLLRSRA